MSVKRTVGDLVDILRKYGMSKQTIESILREIGVPKNKIEENLSRLPEQSQDIQEDLGYLPVESELRRQRLLIENIRKELDRVNDKIRELNLKPRVEERSFQELAKRIERLEAKVSGILDALKDTGLIDEI